MPDLGREESARRLCELLPRWTYYPQLPPGSAFAPHAGFITMHGEHGQEYEEDVELPAPDAPLHEHLAFVGRVAEAVGCKTPALAWGPEGQAIVSLDDDEGYGISRDISESVLLAALTSVQARGGGK